MLLKISAKGLREKARPETGFRICSSGSVGVVEVCPQRRAVQAIDRLEEMKTRRSLNKASGSQTCSSTSCHDKT